ncbi:hypothetical protein GE061_011184 [Apolygus lucorum]|uniref:BDBT FKBP like N-terminal domain-containing protein n=1 Tax=Apolygus lucorum TaxID=248454 RepID=A0A8S9XXW7_APOLU|nr:hypothetical protein GE061_011184 [Apolygus lucorum]
MDDAKSSRRKAWKYLLECETLDDLMCVGSSDEEDHRPCMKRNQAKHTAEPEFLGKMYLKRSMWAQAAQALTEAISLNNNNSSLFSNRSIALLKLGQFKSAEADCTKALDIKKNSFKACLRRAIARKYQGKYIDACLDCWKLFDAHPTLECEQSIVRKEYDKMVEHAIEELIGLIVEQKCPSISIEKLRNEFAAKEKYFGNQLLLMKKHDKAIIKYTNAIRLISKDSTFYANRALCWMELKKYKEAERDCSKALLLDKNYEKVLVRRARARKAMGNLLGAKHDFLSALNLNEENRIVQGELRELEKSFKSNTLLLKNYKAREERT